MQWCRFQTGQHVSYGIVEDERVIEVAGSPLADHTVTRTSYPLGQVKLLPPVIPPMLYAAGPNYRGHVEGMARRRGATPHYPARPEPNFRSVHALIGPEEGCDHGVGHPSCLCAGAKALQHRRKKGIQGLKFLSGVADTVIKA